jgi:hypothetical protein
MNTKTRFSLTVLMVFITTFFQACAIRPEPVASLAPAPGQSASPTTLPTAALTTEPSPAPHLTTPPDLAPTSVPAGVFVYHSYPFLALDYSPDEWKDETDYTNQKIIKNSLQSVKLKSCQINAAGPFGINQTYPTFVGKTDQLEYVVWPSADKDVKSGLYFINHFKDQPVYMPVVPMFFITASPNEWKTCQKAGEKVINTLHLIPGGVPLIPTPEPTDSPEGRPTPIPSSTATSAPPVTPVPEGIFALKKAPPFFLKYNPGQWKDLSDYSSQDPKQNSLQAKNLQTCQITPQDEINFTEPDSFEGKRFDKVQYTVFYYTSENALFYFDNASYWDKLTYPLLIFKVSSSQMELKACQTLAESVLATLAIQ